MRHRTQGFTVHRRFGHGSVTRRDFVGDTTVLASVRQVLREPVLSAEAILGPSLDPAGRTRRELAEHARGWIVATLGTGERAPAERRAAA